MIKKYIVLFSISILSGQNLLDESFNNPDDLPGGWQFIPESYPTNTGQWQINQIGLVLLISMPLPQHTIGAHLFQIHLLILMKGIICIHP